MRRLVQLCNELSRARRGEEKVAALVDFFYAASPDDAAWVLTLILGRARLPRIQSALLRDWAADEAQIPIWLLDECYEAVGDLSETIALLLPEPAVTKDFTLSELIAQRVLPLRKLHPEKQRESVLQSWRELSGEERWLFQKMISGRFRINVPRSLVIRAFFQIAALPPSVISSRLSADWQPTAEDFKRMLSRDGIDETAPFGHGQPYPFHSGCPLTSPLEELGSIADWQIEWKWDGIRVQLVHRQGDIFIWSSDEESLLEKCPEIVRAADVALPEGTVLDGVLVAWSNEGVLPLSVLHRRLRGEKVSQRLISATPIVFVAFDLLEWQGTDQRHLPLSERRQKLEQWFQGQSSERLRLSPLLRPESWAALRLAHESCRSKRMGGIMLKRRASVYGEGQVFGAWLEWPREPYRIHGVLMYVQMAANRWEITDSGLACTFGVWRGDELVPVAKVDCSLNEMDMLELDRFFRENTTGRFGPVRIVKPELVFELSFGDIQDSTRHKAGLILRRPRIIKWCNDRSADKAGSMEMLRGLLIR